MIALETRVMVKLPSHREIGKGSSLRVSESPWTEIRNSPEFWGNVSSLTCTKNCLILKGEK